MGAKSLKDFHDSDDVREIMNSCTRSAVTDRTANDGLALSYSRSARSYSNFKSTSELDVDETQIKITELQDGKGPKGIFKKMKGLNSDL